MKLKIFISILVILLFLVSCSGQTKQNTVNDVQANSNNIEKTSNEKLDSIDNVANTQASNSEKTAETSKEEIKETVDSSKSSEPDTTANTNEKTTVFDDALDDCKILTVDDIKKVCGVTTTPEAQTVDSDKGQICIMIFKTDDPTKALKVHYTGDNTKSTLSTESLAELSCTGMKAETITDYACYAEMAGKTTFVYGKKRNIGIANLLPMDDYFVCSREQLKELGKIASDRLYP